MKYEEYIAEEEVRDPEFRAERERLQPQYEFRKALIGAGLAAGLTQKQLAERLGTKQSAIARMESGTMLPSVETLYRLSSELDVKIEIAPQTGLTFHPIGRRGGIAQRGQRTVQQNTQREPVGSVPGSRD